MQNTVKIWIGAFLGLVILSSQGMAESISPEKNVTSVPTFAPQFGLGLTVIPARAFWNLDDQRGFYLGGGSVDFLFRVHPRITIELAVGAIGTDHGPGKYQAVDPLNSGYYHARYGEISVSPAIRVYLRKAPLESRPFFFAPYLVGGLEFQVALSSLYSDPPSRVDVSAVQLGGQLGLGFEFRLRSKFVIHVDARAILRGNLLSNSPDSTGGLPSTDSSTTSRDVGLQIGTGFAYFF